MTKINDPHAGCQWYQHLSARSRMSNLAQSDRMVYSALVNQHRYDRPVPVPTGLDKRTVRAAAGRLRAAGYLSDRGEPLPPPAGHPFVSVRAGGRWLDGFGTYRVWSPQPAGPLTPGSAVLYGLLRSLAKAAPSLLGQTNAGLAKILNVDRQTVGRDVKRLVRAGLLTHHKGTRVRGTWAVVFNPAPPEGVFLAADTALTADDFAGVADQVKIHASKSVRPETEPVAQNGGWESIDGADRVAHMLRRIMAEDPGNGWLQTRWPVEILRLWWPHYLEWAGNTSHDETWLAAVFAEAREIHGKFGKSQSCAALCLDRLKKRVAGAGCGFEPMPVGPVQAPDSETPALTDAVRRDERKRQEEAARERRRQEAEAVKAAAARERQEAEDLSARLLAEKLARSI